MLSYTHSQAQETSEFNFLLLDTPSSGSFVAHLKNVGPTIYHEEFFREHRTLTLEYWVEWILDSSLSTAKKDYKLKEGKKEREKHDSNEKRKWLTRWPTLITLGTERPIC